MNLDTARDCAARWGVSEARARRILAPVDPVDRDPTTGAMRYDPAVADAARVRQPGRGSRQDLTGSALAVEDFQRLIANETIPVAHRALWALLWDGHARLNDALSLDVRDVDLNSRTIKADYPKQLHDERVIPISDRTAGLLRDTIGARDAGPLLTGDGDRPLTREAASRWASRWADGIHAFRTGGKLAGWHQLGDQPSP
ncbi:tyrosine-type recombinase/integrase [Streptomyces sioyaensis]|uniref:tyrosine-type recombinase/integrase n=1 Tax=Streptomyces sioyaensis TaxID=67364 RepID=UPI003D7500F1